MIEKGAEAPAPPATVPVLLALCSRSFARRAAFRLGHAGGRIDDLTLQRNGVSHSSGDTHVARETHVDLLSYAVRAEALARVRGSRTERALLRGDQSRRRLDLFRRSGDRHVAD